MKTSENGIAFIKEQEGFTPEPKLDNGHLMWGHGHDQRTGERVPNFITESDSDVLLRKDLLADYEPHVNALAPWATQNQFDALIDFAYNLGAGALATMLHHGKEQVPTQMLAWCYEHINGVVRKNDGLLARRKKEVALYGA